MKCLHLLILGFSPRQKNTVSFKNLINKTRRNKYLNLYKAYQRLQERTNQMAYFKNITINVKVCYKTTLECEESFE